LIGDYDPWIESVIIGINEDEGAVFVSYLGASLPIHFVSIISQAKASVYQTYKREIATSRMKRRHGFDEETANAIFDMYPTELPKEDLSNVRTMPATHFICMCTLLCSHASSLNAVTADYSYITPLVHAAKSISSVPNKATGKTIPIYVYLCRTTTSEIKRVMGVYGNM
jgi:hypothetical protein